MPLIQDIYDLTRIRGLSPDEAQHRLQAEGLNELPSTRRRSLLGVIFEVIREPMFLLLVACGTIYLCLGETQEACLLLSFVFVIMGITIYQERKTERALEALRDLSSPRALVIRDGEQKRIPGREVVRGDIIVVSEGDRVPADARLLAGVNLSADESMLTGESVSVRKQPWDGKLATGRPGGDDLPFLYSGSLIVQGQGVAEVTTTGLHTEMGKIGKALQEIEPEKTLLQREIGTIVRNFSVIGLLFCLLIIVVFGLTRGDWIQGLLAGLTLAMAILPEEFPVVLTIFLALGAWRMSRQRVLTRRVPAVETLGAATVLCVDKTGTLTWNRMNVQRLAAGRETLDFTVPPTQIPESFHPVLEYSILASQKNPFDPMEKAIRQMGIDYLAKTEHLHDNWTLVHEYPLSRELLALSNVWKSPDGSEYEIAAKGAPEAIADLCHFTPEQVRDMERQVEAMAADGLRVLGVARARFRQGELPRKQHDFQFEFIGLIGLADPVRPTVAGAIGECYSAGIRVIMITGDYPGTALNIARQIGLRSEETLITGPELETMDTVKLQERIKKVNIFARVVPEQKLRIVNALKAAGEVVAMTGDGVNDAPALKSAHIGIAMGGRGTDVARESSSLVLLDDDFTSIVQAVRMGRRIYDNIRKAMGYIMAIHVPIAGLSLIPVFFKDWPLLLLPVHIVFLELIIDPACSVVFEMEKEEADVMNRPPRPATERLFSFRTVSFYLLQGLSVLLIVLAVFYAVLKHGHSHQDVCTLAFATLVIANIGLILTNRSWSRTIIGTLRTPNPALWQVLGGALLLLILTIYVPFLRNLFHFAVLHPLDWAFALIAGAASIFWFELLKLCGKGPRSG